MAKLEQPFIMRDFRQGRYTPTQVSNYLVPQNSVSQCININFDTVVGSAVVRPGTTKLGATVASTRTPLGLAEFVGKGGTPNLLLAVFKGASTASIYYYNGSWNTSSKTNLSNTAKDRFAVLGGSSFITNSTDGMFDSTDGNTWGTTNSIPAMSVKPSLVYRYTARLLASGDPTYPSRIYFSSIVNSATSPFITWNTDQTTGDWIDVNPDDGGYNTGFAETSTFLLNFKNNAMYRVDVVTKSTDPQNIFNIGAVSQEAIVACQGIVYFFSGIDIRRTNGGFPEQISRAGVQDIVDAIPTANWNEVYGWTDTLNVYFSVGDVTLLTAQNLQFTIPRCVLKFSPRDQNWSVHSYADNFKFGAVYTTSTGRLLRVADVDGDVQTLNIGKTDNGTAINFLLEGQDLEFGARNQLKQISDQITIYTNNGIDSTVQFRIDGNDLVPVDITTTYRVNIGKNIDIKGNFFGFRWYGTSVGTPPTLEGFEISSVSYLGENTNHG